MSLLNPSVGDIVRIPQNVLLIDERKTRWLKTPTPEYGVVVDICSQLFPTVYKIFLRGNIWEAAEKDIFLIE